MRTLFCLKLIALTLLSGAGCSPWLLDSDHDGTVDAADGCPDDPAKTEPGQCGCGIPETDSNNNGTPDCVDPPTGTASIAGSLYVQSDTGTAAEFVPGELLVAFKNGMNAEDQQCLLTSCNLCCLERSPRGPARVACPVSKNASVQVQSAETLQALNTLHRLPGVRYAEPNLRRHIARTPNDPFFKNQWHYTAINLPDAWDYTIGDDNIIVAIVDTGILSHHPDLQGRIVAGYDFIEDAASARDGDGRDGNPEDAGDLFGGPGQSSFHGTIMAGIIAATTDNAIGVAGITWRSRIMPVRALGVNGGTAFDVAEAIRFAAGLPNVSGTVPAQPARIINLSVAGEAGAPPSTFENDAITDATNAGVLIVGAAGNENSSLPNYPAAFPPVISVGGLDIELNRAPYSNFGPTLDLMAPGGFTGSDLNGDGFADGILSTGADDSESTISYEYTFNNGTSMATPQVAGVAALVMAANPALNADEVRSILETTAQDLGAPGRDDEFGFGIVDAAAAVREALSRAGTAPSSTPVLSLSVNTLDFGEDRTELHVHISNNGGGFLNVTSVAPSEQQGSGWLSAALGGGTANANADNILVTVKRAGQPLGTLNGTVTIKAENLPPATIHVIMTVGVNDIAQDTIFVLAVSPPPSTNSIGQDETNASRDFAFQISDLPAGDYVIYAGTDRNNDGVICEDGDLCGALPSLSQPQIVTLTPGQQLGNINFSVAQRVLQQVTSENAYRFPKLRRLR